MTKLQIEQKYASIAEILQDGKIKTNEQQAALKSELDELHKQYVLMNTPTSASLLIDALQPKHRAILFTALNLFLVANEDQLNEHLSHNEMAVPLAHMVKDALAWNITEIVEVRKILFAECFPDDLKLEPFAIAAIQHAKKGAVASES